MPIVIGAAPESDFSDPLGLMSDCHRRIERFLDVLLVVAAEGAGRELSAAQREGLDVALRYFRKAGPLHTEDEEESLFPRLRQQGGEDLLAIMDKIERLEEDHRKAAALHAEVSRLGEKWLEEGVLSPQEAGGLSESLWNLRLLYQAHIAIEDYQLFPAASVTLAPSLIAVIGREMAVRRHVDPDVEQTLSRCAARRAVTLQCVEV